MPDRSVPTELDAQVGLYRSLLADRRVLVVLDNAFDTEQVLPLLPGGARCCVLVTTRRRLPALLSTHGGRSIALATLPDGESRALLVDRVGEHRIRVESKAVDELLGVCGGLPLALTIVAAQLATHESFPVHSLAEELHERATRLDGLDMGEVSMNLSTVFLSSYRALSPDAATLVGLLGAAVGPDIGVPAATALSGLPPSRLRVLLRELENSHLLTQPEPGRYRMHDLLRIFAAEKAQDLPSDQIATARRRLIDFYLHTACRAELMLTPTRQPVEQVEPASGSAPLTLPDNATAWAWFDAEHPCLLDAQRLAAELGWHTTAWHLAWSMTTYHRRRGHVDDYLTVWRIAFAALRQGDDQNADLIVLRRLGNAYSWLGRYAESLDHLTHALQLSEQMNDPLSVAHNHHAIAVTWEFQHDYDAALRHATTALNLYRQLDRPLWEAELLNLVGSLSVRLGYHQQAQQRCEAALTLFRQHGHRYGEATTLSGLAEIARQSGQPGEALNLTGEALTIFRELGHTYDEANLLEKTGNLHADLGQHKEANAAWAQAHDMYRAQHRTAEAKRTETRLTDSAQ